MGSALLSQIQSHAVDGIIATGCSTHTHTLSHRQETDKKAVATATKRSYKGLYPHKTAFMSIALDIMSIEQCLFTGAMLNLVICTLLFAHTGIT